MSTEITPVQQKFRKRVPEEFQQSMDTRLYWLWNQKFGTIQTIYQHSPDLLDRTACTIILQSILGGDLDSISLLFQRIEGGPVGDEAILEQTSMQV